MNDENVPKQRRDLRFHPKTYFTLMEGAGLNRVRFVAALVFKLQFFSRCVSTQAHESPGAFHPDFASRQ